MLHGVHRAARDFMSDVLCALLVVFEQGQRSLGAAHEVSMLWGCLTGRPCGTPPSSIKYTRSANCSCCRRAWLCASKMLFSCRGCWAAGGRAPGAVHGLLHVRAHDRQRRPHRHGDPARAGRPCAGTFSCTAHLTSCIAHPTTADPAPAGPCMSDCNSLHTHNGFTPWDPLCCPDMGCSSPSDARLTEQRRLVHGRCSQWPAQVPVV